MERDLYKTVLLFTESDRFGDMPMRDRWRLLKRKPKVAYLMGAAWVAGVFGGSRFRHVAISDGDVVVNFEFLRRNYWSHEAYVGSNQILGYVEIESDSKLELSSLPSLDRSRWMLPLTVLFLLMGITRGFYQVNNCTISAKQALWGAGIDIPDRSIWCPTKLLLWLMENGKDFVAGSPSADSDTADRGAGQDEPAGDGGLSCDQC